MGFQFDGTPPLFIFAIVAFAFGVIPKKSLSRLMSSKFFHIFSTVFIVSGFMFKSLMHFELIYVRSVR